MNTRIQVAVFVAFVLSVTNCGFAQISPNAPKDNPFHGTEQNLAPLERAIASLIQDARKSYPAARTRFLAGLPEGEHFFVVTRLRDNAGRFEQVFIRVQAITDSTISGIISSEIQLVSGYKTGQGYQFDDADLIDWVITKRDGSEEGNLIGKFLDSYMP